MQKKRHFYTKNFPFGFEGRSSKGPHGNGNQKYTLIWLSYMDHPCKYWGKKENCSKSMFQQVRFHLPSSLIKASASLRSELSWLTLESLGCRVSLTKWDGNSGQTGHSSQSWLHPSRLRKFVRHASNDKDWQGRPSPSSWPFEPHVRGAEQRYFTTNILHCLARQSWSRV